jgi:hypothetical protein
MLEEIIADHVERVAASNQPTFRTDIDYDAIVEHRNKVAESWRKLDAHVKAEYKNQAAYELANGVQDPRNPELIPARNLSLIRREVSERLNTSNFLKLLPLDALDFRDSLIELADSVENSTDIRELYKLRKITTGTSKNAGINA